MISKDGSGISGVVLRNDLKQGNIYGRHAFFDKLRERMSFERTGTKLYEALLSKYYSLENKTDSHSHKIQDLPPIYQLEKFCNEEKNHFEMTKKLLLSMGLNSSSLEDVNGMVESSWIQIIEDSQTSFVQALEIILQAELVDNAGWEILIELAESLNLDAAVLEFEHALEEENVHLAYVRAWVSQLYLNGKIDEDPYAINEEDLMDDTADEEFYTKETNFIS